MGVREFGTNLHCVLSTQTFCLEYDTGAYTVRVRSVCAVLPSLFLCALLANPGTR